MNGKQLLIGILSYISLLLLSNNGIANTLVNGEVRGHWTTEGSPYIATANISLASRDTLTIDPGVQVFFSPNTFFEVFGMLTAIGTEQDSITFRANNGQIGGWLRLKITGMSASSTRLQHCIIQHTEWGLNIVGSQPVVDHCRISHHARFCIDIESGSPVITNCDIVQSNDNGVRIDENSRPVLRYCRIHGITDVGITIRGGSSAVIDHIIFTRIPEIALSLTEAGACSLSYNRFYECGLAAINLFQSNRSVVYKNIVYRCEGTYAVYVNNSNPTTILNNTIYDCPNTGLAVISSGADIINNIVALSGQNGIFAQRSNVNISYNDIWNNGTDYGGDAAAGDFDISENPILVSPALHDFRPQEGSPVINTGSPRHWDPDRTVSDIGAEFFNMNQKPVVTAFWPESLEMVDINQEVEFGVEASDPEGVVLTYKWYVNDELLLQGEQPTFTYRFREIGDFSVSVNIDDRSWLGDTTLVWEFPVSVEDNELIPQSITLSEVYPNPFNETARISLTLPHQDDVSVKIFDLTGKFVQEIWNGYTSAGIHEFTVSAKDLNTGIYILRIEGNQSYDTQRLVVLR